MGRREGAGRRSRKDDTRTAGSLPDLSDGILSYELYTAIYAVTSKKLLKWVGNHRIAKRVLAVGDFLVRIRSRDFLQLPRSHSKHRRAQSCQQST